MFHVYTIFRPPYNLAYHRSVNFCETFWRISEVWGDTQAYNLEKCLIYLLTFSTGWFLIYFFIAWQSKRSVVKRNTFMKFAMRCSTRWQTLPTHLKIITARCKAFTTGWNALQPIFNAFSNVFSIHFRLVSYAGFSQIGSQLSYVLNFTVSCQTSVTIKLQITIWNAPLSVPFS